MLKDSVAGLLGSSAFLNWKPKPKDLPDGDFVIDADIVSEKHYTIGEVAEMWSVSEDLIRDIFKDEAGVIQFVRPGTRLKRQYTTTRIPESVVKRVHRKLTGQ